MIRPIATNTNTNTNIQIRIKVNGSGNTFRGCYINPDYREAHVWQTYVTQWRRPADANPHILIPKYHHHAARNAVSFTKHLITSHRMTRAETMSGAIPYILSYDSTPNNIITATINITFYLTRALEGGGQILSPPPTHTPILPGYLKNGDAKRRHFWRTCR